MTKDVLFDFNRSGLQTRSLAVTPRPVEPPNRGQRVVWSDYMGSRLMGS
jgi:hypothetical protein